jgi:hypothetical protein
VNLRNLLILSALLASLLGCSKTEQITGPQIQAVDYIVKAELGSNLTRFAYSKAKVTQTYQTIQSEIGNDEAQRIIAIELDKAIKKHQQQWNENLAQAHTGYLTNKEINSLYYNGKNSPYSIKRNKVQIKIGKRMQSSSDDLLAKVVSEGLQEAYKKAVQK